ncbi:MAG: recombinase family protein [Candidatus Thermoplasmatota archaeon]|nr:recombinase family protein [Candidatus Thermoplasmatota archaeon]
MARHRGIKPRKAKSWSVQTIWQMLKNPIYHGECHYKDIEWTDEELVVV